MVWDNIWLCEGRRWWAYQCRNRYLLWNRCQRKEVGLEHLCQVHPLGSVSYETLLNERFGRLTDVEVVWE